MIIAIDGPAGSGKSTLAKVLAKKLDILFVDTGAMYRALTVKALKSKADLNDESVLVKLLTQSDIKLIADNRNSTLKVLLDSQDVSEEIRLPEVTRQVMFIAKMPAVRMEMVKKQRQLVEGHDVVLEGRDIGTVVFPQAEKKFYLDASVEERAKRRLKDLVNANCKTTLQEVMDDIKKRDKSDFERKVAPLKKAQDALVIDTTGLSIEQVCEIMIKEIKK